MLLIDGSLSVVHLGIATVAESCDLSEFTLGTLDGGWTLCALHAFDEEGAHRGNI